MLYYMARETVSHGIKAINQLLRYGDHPGISRWAQCNHKHSLNVEERGRRSESERVKEALLYFEDRGRGKEGRGKPRKAGSV